MSGERADGFRSAGHSVGADASSDKLQRGARCTKCGTKGATLQQPGWMGEQIGFAPCAGAKGRSDALCLRASRRPSTEPA
jgi:hypothetical protein